MSKLDYRQYYLSGCIDIIVVQQFNGSLKSTPFHVRFGKFVGQELPIEILINGNLTDVKMKLGPDGSGQFEKTQPSSGYQSDSAFPDKNFMSEDETSLSHQYIKPDELFNSDKKNSTWFQSLKFWSKGSTQKKEDETRIFSTSLTKEFQQEDTSLQSLQQQNSQQSQIQLQNQQLQYYEKEVAQSDKETLSPRQSTIEISLCGQQFQQPNLTSMQRSQIFEQQKISFSSYEKDPFKILNNKDLVIKIGEQFYTKEAGLIQLLAKSVFQQEISIESLQSKKVAGSQQWFSRMFGKKKGSEQIEANNTQKDNTSKKSIQQSKSTDRVRKLSEQTDVQSVNSLTKRKRQSRPTLKPNSAILQKLNLVKGANKITFRLCTPKKSDQQELHGTIFLYDQSTKIVISDIDGTITKSDILGQLMPKLGTDWNHDGVTLLYQKIQSMGYSILYLTARAIGQADQTKEFIYNLQQQKVKLPFGPIILSPDSLFPAFKREIIDGTPEVFKINALREIRNLFLGDSPFYCGFGNRLNDATAYQAANVDIGRIYIIDPESKIHKYNSDEVTTYIEMNENINLYFPPVSETEYQPQNFWKLPVNLQINFDYQ